MMNHTGHDRQTRRTIESPARPIILAFGNKWLDPLLNREISVIFRKMGPSPGPTLLYAYVAAPTSAIVAKMPVIGYEQMPKEDALLLADEGRISKEELLAYAAKYTQLFVFRVGKIQTASKPITVKQLKEDFHYWPSPTFTPLTAEQAEAFDRLGFSGK